MDNNTLKAYGIDYDRGLKNCMGDVTFYKKILSMFIKDDCFKRGETAYAERDYKSLFACMHEMKGVSGNVALTGLYNATVPLVELLRDGTDDDEKVDTLFINIRKEYTRTYDGITAIMAEI